MQPMSASRRGSPPSPIEFIVPAGTGGGADQMARFLQGVIAKHNLSKQPFIVVNKSGGAGAEGFLDVKGAKGDPHKIIITLSNLFTTPLATGVPFNWKDLTPVAMLALDEFVLWVNAETPYKTARRLHRRRSRPAPNGQFKMARHRLEAGRPDHHGRAREGHRQEDDLHAVQGRRRRRRATRRQARRLDGEQPDRGGRALALGRAAAAVRVRQQADAVSRTRSRPTQSWQDIPTCKSQGLDVEYTMLRGIFMPAGVTQEQVDYYIDIFKKVRELPEWKKFTEDAAFNDDVHDGQAVRRLGRDGRERRTSELMQEAGFLAAK